MNSDHSPTAEERLQAENNVEDLRNGGQAYYDIAYELQGHLTAALRENQKKDARIAELKAECELAWGARHDWFAATGDANRKRYEVEAKLRAVSEATIKYYSEGRVDCLLARIRAIVDGK